jgi:hypothetical protein
MGHSRIDNMLVRSPLQGYSHLQSRNIWQPIKKPWSGQTGVNMFIEAIVLLMGQATSVPASSKIEVTCNAKSSRGEAASYFFSIDPASKTFTGTKDSLIDLNGEAEIGENQVTLVRKSETSGLIYTYSFDRITSVFKLMLDRVGSPSLPHQVEEGTCQKFVGRAF